jgi:glutamate formiminotransferase
MTAVVQFWVKKKQDVNHSRFDVGNVRSIKSTAFMKQQNAVLYVDTNILEKYGASIFRVEPTLKTETAGSSEMLVPVYQTT